MAAHQTVLHKGIGVRELFSFDACTGRYRVRFDLQYGGNPKTVSYFVDNMDQLREVREKAHYALIAAFKKENVLVGDEDKLAELQSEYWCVPDWYIAINS